MAIRNIIHNQLQTWEKISGMNQQQILNWFPDSFYNGFYAFFLVMMCLAWIFTGLMVEEFILGCTENITLLQSLKLEMVFDNLCSDDQWIKNSIIQIVAGGLYGYMMSTIAYQIKDLYKKKGNNTSEGL